MDVEEELERLGASTLVKREREREKETIRRDGAREACGSGTFGARHLTSSIYTEKDVG